MAIPADLSYRFEISPGIYVVRNEGTAPQGRAMRLMAERISQKARQKYARYQEEMSRACRSTEDSDDPHFRFDQA